MVKMFNEYKWNKWYKDNKNSNNSLNQNISSMKIKYRNKRSKLSINKLSNAVIEDIECNIAVHSWFLFLVNVIIALLIIVIIICDVSSYISINNSILSLLMIILSISAPLWVSIIMKRTIKLIEKFYNISVPIEAIFESFLISLVPFYIAEISLLLSAYFSSEGISNTYFIISTIVVLISIWPMIFGINSTLELYLRNIMTSISKNYVNKLENTIIKEIDNKSNDINYKNKLNTKMLFRKCVYNKNLYYCKINKDIVVEIPTKCLGVIEVPMVIYLNEIKNS